VGWGKRGANGGLELKSMPYGLSLPGVAAASSTLHYLSTRTYTYTKGSLFSIHKYMHMCVYTHKHTHTHTHTHTVSDSDILPKANEGKPRPGKMTEVKRQKGHWQRV